MINRDKLRTGLVIRNKETQSSGVVIDWGHKGVKFLGYLPVPAYSKKADAVRVWTSLGSSVEVWSLASVSLEKR